MVQVDVFWSYGFGAGFALAASRQLIQAAKDGKANWFENKYFTHSLLFLSIVFVPSGACLLWAFPSWETMHAGDRNLPAWLVTIFTVTNITQGVLGFWITYKLLISGRRYLAFLQLPLGYFMMFFILVHGWDGTGYKRFFSYENADFLEWSIWNIPQWFVSPVAITLYIFGLFLLPWLFYLMSTWIIEGYENPEDKLKNHRQRIIVTFLKLIFGYTLSMAIAASIFIHLLGWIVGPVLFGLASYFVVLRKGALLHKLSSNLMLSKGDW